MPNHYHYVLSYFLLKVPILVVDLFGWLMSASLGRAQEQNEEGPFAMYASLICMPYMHASLICMPPLYVCLICTGAKRGRAVRELQVSADAREPSAP